MSQDSYIKAVVLMTDVLSRFVKCFNLFDWSKIIMNSDNESQKITGDILVVNDDPENLKFLTELLTEAGFQVRSANNAELALYLIHTKQPLLILLTVTMPIMNGFELCRRLKENKETQDIPIIFVSALTDIEKVKGFELGAVDYITKSLNPEEVLARVKTHLNLSIKWQQLKQQNRQLKEAELRYRMVADFTYDWETWISSTGEWLYCSPSCQRITGYEASAFLANPKLLIDITHPNDKRSLERHFRFLEINATLPPHHIVFRIQRADGQEIWIEHVCQSIFDNNGLCLGRRATNRDITARKIAETALIHSKQAVEAANIAKSRFIATMSHELRTPLNAILGFSELMGQDTNLTAKQKEKLGIINRSGAHLLNMINDILDISKIETGRIEVNNQAFDLIKLLHDISDMVNQRIIAKQLKFSLELSQNLPQYIQGDSVKLRQVIINLLSNAIKFTQQGNIILRSYSELLEQSTNNILLIIEVHDSGTGIPLEQQYRLFKPFEQLNRTNATTEGTGLGLAISKSLIELMSGKISVNSILGIGSTFRIQLPVSIAKAADIDLQPLSKPIINIAEDQPEWRLLIADDNADNRLLLKDILTHVGFEIIEATNGQEAIELFKQRQPHLIWMDMSMPIIDGYEATKQIRQLEGGEKVKIIAITASAFTEQYADIIQS
ncbi:partial two-component system, sensor histidine kinase and response regulator, partial [Patescibacteria group bacterium]